MAQRLAKSYGFEVISAKFSHEHAALIAGFIDVERQKIFVNHKDTPAQQNFTIAHELGHYLLRHHERESYKDSYSVMLRNMQLEEHPMTEEVRMELEANWFASNLLVPTSFLRERVQQYPHATDELLADMFGVEPDVIRKRKFSNRFVFWGAIFLFL